MYKLNKFPDGASYVNVDSTEPVTFRTNSYEDLWHLAQYVDAFNSKFGFPPNVTIPNLLDAQADRRFNKGESFGLKLVLKFLKSLNVKQYYIFHPHNQEVVEMYLDNVTIIDNSEFIGKRVLNQLNCNPYLYDTYDYVRDNTENLILLSADAGGFKPLMKLCNKINWEGTSESASKSRKGGIVGEQRLPMDDFGGKDVLIVDDIAVYGGTFKGLSKLLRRRNVGKLYLAVSHITIQNHKPNPNVPNDKPMFEYFDKVFTTNSKFDNYWVENKFGEPMKPKNLSVIKMFDV